MYAHRVSIKERQVMPKKKAGHVSRYLAASTIHGFRYFAASEGGSLLERCSWVACIAIQFTLASIIIWNAFISWQESPSVSNVLGAFHCTERTKKERPYLLILFQISSMDMVAYRTVRFPDVSVCLEGSPVWRAVMEEARELDQDNQVQSILCE